MLELRATDPRFKLVELSRNFGHQIALTAGVDVAAGDAVIDAWTPTCRTRPRSCSSSSRAGARATTSSTRVRTERAGETWFKRTTARGFYRAASDRISEVKVPLDVGDFRLVDRQALDVFSRDAREQPLRARHVQLDRASTRPASSTSRAERFAGETEVPAPERCCVSPSTAIISFSTAPLRAALSVGFVVSFLSVRVRVCRAIVGSSSAIYDVPGWTSIVVVVTSFVLGIQLIVLGVIGEYIGRIYDEVKRRPIYIVRNRHGLVGTAIPGRTSVARDE